MISLAVFDDQDAAVAAERAGKDNLPVEGRHHLGVGARLDRHAAMRLAALAGLAPGQHDLAARKTASLAEKRIHIQDQHPQLWAELRLAVRMYFDPRYRISRTAQLAFPLAAVLMVLNYFFFAQWLSLPVFSPLVERVLYVLLGVFLYRVLQRELDRYKAVLDYLARFTHQ